MNNTLLQKPVFSVIIITYNQANYIAETLDSILEQEHNYDYEIVIGDDASTDDTQMVLQRYQQAHPNIIHLILRQKNLGLIHNYFDTLSQCRGEYIMDCGGDDYWVQGKVALQIPYMQAHPETGLCHTCVEAWHTATDSRGLWDGSGTSFQELIQRNRVSTVTAIYRRELIQQYVNEVQPTTQPWLMEDYPFILWFALRSRIDYLPDCTAVYRVLPESVSHSSSWEKIERMRNSILDVRRYFSALAGVEFDEKAQIESMYSTLAQDAWLKRDYAQAKHYYSLIHIVSLKQAVKATICGILAK